MLEILSIPGIRERIAPITIERYHRMIDLGVFMGSSDEQFRNRKPTSALFVIEVAVNSLDVDRAKTPIYAQAGIPEYWIVQPEARITEIYRNPVNGEYRDTTEVPAETTLESTGRPGFTFNLAETLAD